MAGKLIPEALPQAATMGKRVTIRGMVFEWLTEHGYDGLSGPECGCELSDLMPCGDPPMLDCFAGHKAICRPETCPRKGECDFGEPPSEWCMQVGKPPGKET